MDINVRLQGSGGGNGRQGKLSARGSSDRATQITRQAHNINNSGVMKKVGSSAKGVLRGSASAAFGAVPVVATVFIAAKGADRLVRLGANVYQAWSGEDMLSSNVKAYSKTATNLGLNILSGAIRNEVFIKPRLRRENYMRDYGRDLYTRIGYNAKNDLT